MQHTHHAHQLYPPSLYPPALTGASPLLAGTAFFVTEDKMGWNADGTCTTAGGGFNANRSSISGGVFGTDDAPPQRPPRRPQGGFSMEHLEMAESRDAQHMQQMQQQQQQQQQMMMMQRQRQQQQQQQRQQQQQFMQQQQQQLMMQQRQQQAQQQQMMMQRAQQQQQQMMTMMHEQAAPPSPPTEYETILKKNMTTSIQLGGDEWGANAPSHRGRRPGGKVQQGVTPKECGAFAKGGSSPPGHFNSNGMAAGGYARDQGANRYDSSNFDGFDRGRKAPGGGSSISLGSDAWNGSAPSPRYNKSLNGRSVPVTRNSPALMRTGAGAGMSYYDAPAAGTGQRLDQRAHLGSNVF